MVFDSTAHNVLPFANLTLTANHKGNATDLEGIATIKLDQNFSKTDTLICSYIGYQTKKIAIQLPFSDTFRIALSPSIVYLGAVTIRKKTEKLSGRELVENAIKNIKNNYVSETSNLDVFYRESLYENEKLIELNESLNLMIYTGYPQKGYVKKSWRAYWKDEQKQNSIKGDLLCVGTPQFFKYYNTVKDKCYVKSKRVSRNWSPHKIKAYIYGGPLALTAVDKVKYQADFLDKKLLKKYEYYRKEAVMIDSILCIAVGFKPISNLKNVSQSWDKKVEFPLYSGTIYISREDFTIVKFECQFARNNRTTRYVITEPWQMFPGAIALEVNYKQQNSGKWLLNNVKTQQTFKKNSSLKWKIHENYICTRELFVQGIDDYDEANLDENDLLRDINRAMLRWFPVAYNRDLWSEFDEQKSFKISDKAQKEIEAQMSLTDQFSSKK